jgi:MFS family permease
MIYYRSPQAQPRDLSVSTVRGLSLGALFAYPAGGLLLALAPSTLVTTVAGYALIVVAVGCIVPLLSSSMQRIVGEEVGMLDEYELKLRSKAMNLAYSMFSAIVLLTMVYAAVASDFGLWVPDDYDGFNGLFWGAFVYAVVLPVAVLSWLVDSSFGDEP